MNKLLHASLDGNNDDAITAATATTATAADAAADAADDDDNEHLIFFKSKFHFS